jgi:dehydrogenase/reductase SDR family protein 4
MSQRYKDRVCVVTASTAGIGYAIAERFAAEGGKVVLSSRKQAGVDAAVARIKQNVPGAQVIGRVCHVDKREHRAALFAATAAAFGEIDVLVLNAALSLHGGPTMSTKPEAFDRMLKTNVLTTYVFAQEALEHMKRGDYPTVPGKFTPAILLVGSITGYAPQAPIGMYAVTKTAMIGLMKAMAAELAGDGIRVNLLAPGLIRTSFAAPLIKATERAMKAERAPGSAPGMEGPMGRIGEPAEMGGVAAFLCSADASYVAGETIVAAGHSPHL